MEKISKDELVRRLERAIEAPVGSKGLNILLNGWLKHRKYGNKYREAVNHRPWLYITEAQDLSSYAGYDLTKNEL